MGITYKLFLSRYEAYWKLDKSFKVHVKVIIGTSFNVIFQIIVIYIELWNPIWNYLFHKNINVLKFFWFSSSFRIWTRIKILFCMPEIQKTLFKQFFVFSKNYRQSARPRKSPKSWNHTIIKLMDDPWSVIYVWLVITFTYSYMWH